MSVSLRARVVFPVDRPPIEHGVVTIDGERIVAVGTAPAQDGSTRDLGDVALLPGLVNAHTHFEFSHLQQPLGQPGMPLPQWLPLAIAERQSRRHAAADSIAAGIGESIAAGTSAVGEICTADADAYASPPGEIVLLLEVIGFSRARAASALVALDERLTAARRSHRVGISPHAPYTVSPSLLRMLVELAKRLALPVAMHLAECKEELQFLQCGTGPLQELLDARSMWDPAAIPAGMKPMHYLRMLADAPRTLVVHGNYLGPAEHAYLAEHADRMSLVYCPRTHAWFGHPPYPLAELLKAGVHVALGTDSRASNPDLSLWREMSHVARHHPNVAPIDILRLGTLAGAEALDLDHECGSITPGKLANVIALPLPSRPPGAPNEVLAGLLHADISVPSAAWLRGNQMSG